MKQLDIEYKNAISLELPDLWSRIEAGIDEFEATKKNGNNTENKFDQPEIRVTADQVITNEPVNINERRKNSARTLRYIKRISAAAASILVLVVVIKALGLRGSQSSTAPMSDAADYAAPESAASEAASEATSDEAAYEEFEAAEEASDSESYDESAYEAAEEPAAAAESFNAASEGATSKADDLSKEDRGADNKAKLQYSSNAEISMDSLDKAIGCDKAAVLSIEEKLTELNITKPVYYTMLDDPDGITDYEHFRADEVKGSELVIILFKDAASETDYLMFVQKISEKEVNLLEIVNSEDPEDVRFLAE